MVSVNVGRFLCSRRSLVGSESLVLCTTVATFLLENLLDHLTGARPDSFGKQLASRAFHHLGWNGNAVASTVADPADEDRIGPHDAILAHLLAFFTDGCKALAIRLAGLLLEELVDRLLLNNGEVRLVLRSRGAGNMN